MREYLNWEDFFTMDGFKSHHNVEEALKTFVDNNIMAVKEKGGTSNVNQSY